MAAPDDGVDPRAVDGLWLGVPTVHGVQRAHQGLRQGQRSSFHPEVPMPGAGQH